MSRKKQLPREPQIDWEKAIRLIKRFDAACEEEDCTINEAGLAFHQYTIHQSLEAALGLHAPTTTATQEFLGQ